MMRDLLIGGGGLRFVLRKDGRSNGWTMGGILPERRCSGADASRFHILSGLSKSLNPSEPGAYDEDSKLD